MPFLKERKKAMPMALFVRAVLLMMALIAVGALIFMIKGPGFQEAMRSFFDESPSWNWCPPKVVRLQPASRPAIEVSEHIAVFCRIPIESVTTDEMKSATFAPLLTAFAADGTTVLLEGDLDRGLFRAGGLPFRSPPLQERLRKNSQP